MWPLELSLRSPLPSPLAMNNSAPEGPMRFVKRVILVDARCAETSDRAPSSSKNAVTAIPNFLMENLPSWWPLVALTRASYASPVLGTTNLPRERAPEISDALYYGASIDPAGHAFYLLVKQEGRWLIRSSRIK